MIRRLAVLALLSSALLLPCTGCATMIEATVDAMLDADDDDRCRPRHQHTHRHYHGCGCSTVVVVH